MNCFYCNSKMEEKYNLYICDNKISIIGDIYHEYSVEQSNLNNKEFSYKHIIHTTSINNYICFFVSPDCMNEDSRMITWEKYFLLEDFNLLKEIKTIEQLELFLNKIKTFK